MTIKDPRRTLKISITSLVAVIIIGYSLYQSRNLIEGPRVHIESPQNGSVLSDSLADIKGNAQNTISLSIDDRTVFTDENGNFEEHILLDSGYTIHKVTAKDKFGRVTETDLGLIFSGNAASGTKATETSTSTLKR